MSGLFDKMLTTGLVTDVRAWQPATMFEVDIHLPTIDMEKWDTIKRLKCRVGELEYRDYTPALWNPVKKMCTMFIEAGHNGAGSRWIQQLKKGDEIALGAAHAAQLPSREGKILCLGDGSALGHFLGLKQLTDREKFPIDGAVFLHDHYQVPLSMIENHPEFEFIIQPRGDSYEALQQWCGQKDLSQYSSVYIAGNIPMVGSLRKRLKAVPEIHAKIVGHGFWS